MKLGVSFAQHDAFAKRLGRPGGDRRCHSRIGVGGGNDLQELHIAGWVEEMSAYEVALELFAPAFGDIVDRNTTLVFVETIACGLRRASMASISARFGSRRSTIASRISVGLAQPVEVVGRVAERDQVGRALSKEVSWPCLTHAVEARPN